MTELQAPVADLLRNCVECGLCLPHCATFLATGNEVQSPRGRLLLLGDLLNRAGAEAPASYLSAFDQCIGCRACETVCPSGVPFALLEHGQQLAFASSGVTIAARPNPAVPGPILRRLDSAAFLRVVGTIGEVARRMCRLVFGRNWRRKLDAGPVRAKQLVRLLGSLPTSPTDDVELVLLLDDLVARAGRTAETLGATAEPNAPVSATARGSSVEQVSPAETMAGRPLLFFTGCANAGLLPATSRRLVEILCRAGYAVAFPTGQECCGALATHTGRPGRAAQLRRRNQTAFAASPVAETPPIVVEAAGCSLELAGYDPDFAARVVDAITLLAAAGQPPHRRVPLRVAIHDPCHARHGQGIVEAPRQLLAAIPELTWCEATEKEVCCGSGGAWGLRYPEMSADLARRKAVDLAATGADLVVTTNPGCLGQISDGLALEAPGLPIIPLTDLWWYACRPEPR